MLSLAKKDGKRVGKLQTCFFFPQKRKKSSNILLYIA